MDVRGGREFQIGDIRIAGGVLLAPMSGVSDLPFRKIAQSQGARYVASEMVACEMLAKGRPDVVRRAAGGDVLPLMVIQLVGRDPKWIAEGARLAQAAGAHIVDLNMGCPAREVTGGLSGSALMRDLEQACRLIEAAVGATSRPVTLKMRLGWDDASRNAPLLACAAQQLGIKAITVHARTRQQFFKGSADWRAVADVKSAVAIPVIVNGDIIDIPTTELALALSKCNAVMIGRGAYGQPWIAEHISEALLFGRAPQGPDLRLRLEVALMHLDESMRFYGRDLGLKTFRKHLGWYVEKACMPSDAAERRNIRSALCQLQDEKEIRSALSRLWLAA